MFKLQYPMLTYQEVAEFYEHAFPELQVKEQDFKSPKASRIMQLCSTVLEDITGPSVLDNLNKPFPITDEFLDYAELHMDSKPLLLLTMAMQTLLRRCGFTTFQMKDLTDPKPKKTLLIHCALTNYIRFATERSLDFKSVKEEVEESRAQMESLMKETDTVKCKINSIKAQHSQEEGIVNELNQELDQVTKLTNELKKAEGAEQKTAAALEAQLTGKKARIDQIKQALQKQKEASERLSMQVVQSPERMKAEEEQKRRHLFSIKQVKEVKRKRLIEVREQQPRRQQLERDCDYLLRLLSDLQTKQEEEIELKKQNEDIHEKITNKREKLRIVAHDTEQRKYQLAAKLEKLSKAEIKHKKQMEILLSDLEDNKREHEKYIKLCSENDVVGIDFTEQWSKKFQEFEDIEKQHAEFMASRQALHGQILQKTDDFNTCIFSKLDKAIEDWKQKSRDID